MLASLVDYKNPNSFASRLRRKRFARVLALLQAAHARNGSCKVLDVGGTQTYWNIVPMQLLRDLKVSITLLNLEATPVLSDADVFSSVAGNACDLSPFADGSFDLVHSNSVIEHVGSWHDMCRMAAEVRRVGTAYYMQTPYFWFPVEPHFIFPLIHWMPMSWRYRLAMARPLGTWRKASTVQEAMAAQQSAVLLDRSMVCALFPDATVSFEWFLGLPKSVVAYRG
jgi:hypothetical protein